MKKKYICNPLKENGHYEKYKIKATLLFLYTVPFVLDREM